MATFCCTREYKGLIVLPEIPFWFCDLLLTKEPTSCLLVINSIDDQLDHYQQCNEDYAQVSISTPYP